jgi:cobalt-zinc-cadmium efflux system outer membrane protein
MMHENYAHHSRHRRTSAAAGFLLIVSFAALSACTGTPIAAERAERGELDATTERYRPADELPALPALTTDSTLADFLRFALLNSPRVESAYYDWAAAVERIVAARSLPDPQLRFSADITDAVMSLMPGLMMDLPGPGKLRLAGEVAASESRASFFGFKQEILRTALTVKVSYYRLGFLEEALRVQRETLSLIDDLERLAEQQNAAGLAAMQDVLRAQIARVQLTTQIENLEDSRLALAAEWKAALGLGPGDQDPPIPVTFIPSSDLPVPDALWATALAHNPELRALEYDVRRAESTLALALKAGVPDFQVGLEVDVLADPLIFTPMVGASLPIWRDKISAGISAAQAEKLAANARLTAQEVQLAAELASTLFQYREAVRDEELARVQLLPRARAALAAARASYVNGRAGFLDVIDAQRSLLEYELAGIAAATQRELALAALSLAIAGVPPADAPLPPATEER